LKAANVNGDAEQKQESLVTESKLPRVQSDLRVEIQASVKKEEFVIKQEASIPNHMKIRIDLTGTKYKVLKDCA